MTSGGRGGEVRLDAQASSVNPAKVRTDASTQGRLSSIRARVINVFGLLTSCCDTKRPQSLIKPGGDNVPRRIVDARHWSGTNAARGAGRFASRPRTASIVRRASDSFRPDP
jgi:hypothetical protein